MRDVALVTLVIAVNKHVLQHVISVYSQDVLNVRLVTMVLPVRVCAQIIAKINAIKKMGAV